MLNDASERARQGILWWRLVHLLTHKSFNALLLWTSTGHPHMISRMRQPMLRSSTWQQPLEGRDNVVDGPLVLVLVVAEALVGGGGRVLS